MRVHGAAGAQRGPRDWRGRPAAEGTKRPLDGDRDGPPRLRPGHLAGRPGQCEVFGLGPCGRALGAHVLPARACHAGVPDLAWRRGSRGYAGNNHELRTLSLAGPGRPWSGSCVGVLKPGASTALDPQSQLSYSIQEGSSCPWAGTARRGHVSGSTLLAPLKRPHLSPPPRALVLCPLFPRPEAVSPNSPPRDWSPTKTPRMEKALPLRSVSPSAPASVPSGRCPQVQGLSTWSCFPGTLRSCSAPPYRTPAPPSCQWKPILPSSEGLLDSA